MKPKKVCLQLKPFKKKPTYFTIADLAKCTIATVSRYFNGGYVSKEKQQAISFAISKINYNFNSLAKQMRAPDNVIYLLTTKINNSTNFEVIKSINETIGASCLLFICQTSSDPEGIDSYLNQIRTRNPRIIIVFGDCIPLSNKHFSNFDDSLIFYYGMSNETLSNSIIYNFDEKQAFEKLVDQMFKRDIRKIYFINYDFKKTQFNNAYLQSKRQKIIEDIQKNSKFCKINFIYKTLSDNSTDVISKWTRSFKYHKKTGIICASHSIFRQVRHLKQIYSDLIISDIGYHSLTDSLKTTDFKIFNDYNLIGNLMGEHILDLVRNKKLEINNQILFPSQLLIYKN